MQRGQISGDSRSDNDVQKLNHKCLVARVFTLLSKPLSKVHMQTVSFVICYNVVQLHVTNFSPYTNKCIEIFRSTDDKSFSVLTLT